MWPFGPNIERLSRAKDIAGLSKALRQAREGTKLKIVEALIHIVAEPGECGAKASQALVSAAWTDPAVKTALVNPGIVRNMVALCRSKNKETRANIIGPLAAAVGLGTSEPAAIETLCSLVRDSDATVQRTACYFLGMVGGGEAGTDAMVNTLNGSKDGVLRGLAAFGLARAQRKPEKAVAAMRAFAREVLADEKKEHDFTLEFSVWLSVAGGATDDPALKPSFEYLRSLVK